MREGGKSIDISIHALREEGDTLDGGMVAVRLIFLSTPSARRATCPRWSAPALPKISIHALREEGDQHSLRHLRQPRTFLSTPSARRATKDQIFAIKDADISIHALREEGDLCPFRRAAVCANFYPRPPRGGRLPRGTTPAPPTNFYPRPPRGGRRRGIFCLSDGAVISIHALREEGDAVLVPPFFRRCNFYPRPPRGGRQQKQRQNLYFLINYTTFCTNLEEP